MPTDEREQMAQKKKAEEPEVPAEKATKVEPEQKQRFDFRSLNTLAVVSLASALTSVGAVMAIITGHISLAQLKKPGESGKPLALSGLIVGYLTVGFWIIFLVSSVVFRARVLGDHSGLQLEWFEFREFGNGFGGMHDR